MTDPRNRTGRGVFRRVVLASVAAVVILYVGAGSAAADTSAVSGMKLRCAGKSVTVVGTGGPDTIVGTPASDVVNTLSGNDLISGMEGDDTICPGPGDDLVLGGAGDDVIVSGRGNDDVDGGEGRDVANYGNAPTGVYADLRQGMVWDGWGYLDTTRGVEDLVGSGMRDKLFGGMESNTLRGGRGNDDLYGGGGVDLLDGGFNGEINSCTFDLDDVVVHCS